jgi:hypothetical protein
MHPSWWNSPTDATSNHKEWIAFNPLNIRYPVGNAGYERVKDALAVRMTGNRKSRLSSRGDGSLFFCGNTPAQSAANSARHRMGRDLDRRCEGIGGSDVFVDTKEVKGADFFRGRSQPAERQIPRRWSCRSKHHQHQVLAQADAARRQADIASCTTRAASMRSALSVAAA